MCVSARVSVIWGTGLKMMNGVRQCGDVCVRACVFVYYL